jgi:hypothetical protein
VWWLTDWVWIYRLAHWDGRACAAVRCDEWARRTVAVRLPGSRALVVAYRYCGHPACLLRVVSRG